MYIPTHFSQPDSEQLEQLIHDYPLATVAVTTGDGSPEIHHFPMLLTEDGPNRQLAGHIARANPLAAATMPLAAVAVFHGPQAYITPSWYPGKQETGKVVPTWNFQVVHVHGQLTVVDDPGWVRLQVEQLTDAMERHQTDPWSVSDAPEDFTEQLLKGVVGVRITVEQMLGKWKVSQNQTEATQIGVNAGLRQQQHPDADALSGAG